MRCCKFSLQFFLRLVRDFNLRRVHVLDFRRGRAVNLAVNPKGSVTFWITDGKLVKYAYHVTGTVSFNGNDREVDRTTTTEIKDVNSTKIEVSDDAKKKLE